MPNDLVQALINEVYKDYTNCGISHGDKQYHKRVDWNVSSEVPGLLPHIIPDNFYHPEIKVCIDFTHQFVLKTRNEELEGKRLVSDELLKKIFKKLLNFFVYYFDYVLSYSKNEVRQYMNYLNEMDNEKAILTFLNTILNFMLTSISVNRSRTGIGTATVTLKDNPNYDQKEVGRSAHRSSGNIFIYKALGKAFDIMNQLFVPMLPISIWAKGRLYKNWYFPIFDGYIMHAAPQTTEGFSTISITCKDVLELARISQEMINPAIIQLKEFRKQTTINIFKKPLYGMDHMKIFDMVFNGGFIRYEPGTEDDLGGGTIVTDQDAIREAKNLANPSDYINFMSLGEFDRLTEDAAEYSKSPDMASDTRAVHKDKFNTRKMVEETSHKYRKRATIVWGDSITPYRLFEFQSPDAFTSDFSSRLDIVRDVSGMVYYELYVDGYGNINYHPMRMANDYLVHDIIYGDDNKHKTPFPGSQVIGVQESLDVNTGLNLEEMTTYLRLQGVNPVIAHTTKSELLNLIGSAIHKKYMQRFGYRRKEIKNELFNYNPKILDKNGKQIKFLDLAAASLIKYMNAELLTRTATIIFRPELEIAMPVFFVDDKTVYYIDSITHNVTIGGTATTTINSNFGRMDSQTPPDLANFMLVSEKLYKNGEKAVTLSEEERDATIKVAYEDWVDIDHTEQQSIDAVVASTTQNIAAKSTRDGVVERANAKTQSSRENKARREAAEEAQRRIAGSLED